jgi:hypothetical protein
MLQEREINGWKTVKGDYDFVVDEAADSFNETTEDWGPTEEVAELYDNPKALFFYFLPKSLWRKIAKETNRYERQTRSKRVSDHEKRYTEEQHEKYLKKVDKFIPITACEVSF